MLSTSSIPVISLVRWSSSGTLVEVVPASQETGRRLLRELTLGLHEERVFQLLSQAVHGQTQLRRMMTFRCHASWGCLAPLLKTRDCTIQPQSYPLEARELVSC